MTKDKGQRTSIGMLTLGGGTLIPLGLVLVGGSPPLMFGAATLILLGSLVIRFLLIKIPHVGSQEDRSLESMKYGVPDS